MKILVTGAAGFIGFHVARALAERGEEVVGLDSMNDYYDPELKRARRALLVEQGLPFFEQDLADGPALLQLFEAEGFTHVINLAAQAGVRYSLEVPEAYINSNIVGFANLLQACRLFPVEHLVYASSGSVSGLNQSLPAGVSEPVGHPMTLYAASKRSNELMAHAYAHLFGIPSTGLRFFSVYGPWGRPDMALFLFTKKILEREPIDVFNYGDMTRDWTYIDDIRDGIIAALDRSAEPDPSWDPMQPALASSSAPFRLYHLGRGAPVKLLEAIELLEEALGQKAEKRLKPMQLGDVKDTYAEIDAAIELLDFQPKVDLREGIGHFVRWYRHHYQC